MNRSKTLANLWTILNGKERKNFYFIFLLMVLGAFIELIGIGIVVPVFAIIGESDITIKYPSLKPFLVKLGNPSHANIVIIAMSILLLIYIFKVLFQTFSAYRQSNFIYKLSARLTSRLFELYIKQPYTFHLTTNSAQLIRNATADVVMLASAVQSFLIVLTEIFVLLGLFVLLIFVEPYGAILSMLILSISGFLFHFITKRKVKQWGDANHIHAGKRFQHLQQGLSATKDVKLLGREKEFIKQFDFHNNKMGVYNERQYTVAQLPRLFIELLAIVGLALVVISMTLMGKDVGAILPTLALFVAAAFRMIPSANRVLGSVQTVQFGVASIESVNREIKTLVEPVEKNENEKRVDVFTKEIQLRNLNFTYPTAVRQTINNVSITIQKGQSVGIVGGSGAGKSTLIDIFLGLLKQDSGSILLDGKDIYNNLRGWQDLIGYVPQVIYLTDDTLRRNIAFGLPNEMINDELVSKAVKAAKLEELVTQLPEGLDTEVGERGVRLSGGQRQRIGIARALYHDPEVLVLDEATSSLDQDTEKNIMESVNALHGNKTIIIIAHRLSTVQNCDKIIKLDNGKLIQEGTVNQVLNV
jgi:ABC-type multidrug transport system fused ATPase/permease subunit